MLRVKAYDVIARKYRLFCDEREEQEIKITSRWLQISLTKITVGIDIASVAGNKCTSTPQNVRCVTQLHYSTCQSQKISNVIQDCVIQPWCPECSLSSSFCCHKCKHTSLHTALINAIKCSSIWNLVTRKCILIWMTCWKFTALHITKHDAHTNHLTNQT